MNRQADNIFVVIVIVATTLSPLRCIWHYVASAQDLHASLQCAQQAPRSAHHSLWQEPLRRATQGQQRGQKASLHEAAHDD